MRLPTWRRSLVGLLGFTPQAVPRSCLGNHDAIGSWDMASVRCECGNELHGLQRTCEACGREVPRRPMTARQKLIGWGVVVGVIVAAVVWNHFSTLADEAEARQRSAEQLARQNEPTPALEAAHAPVHQKRTSVDPACYRKGDELCDSKRIDDIEAAADAVEPVLDARGWECFSVLFVSGSDTANDAVVIALRPADCGKPRRVGRSVLSSLAKTLVDRVGSRLRSLGHLDLLQVTDGEGNEQQMSL